MRIFTRLLITALSLLLISYLIPGISVDNFYTALILALIFGVMNLIVRPVLVLLTLPINIITFGLFTLVINGALFWFVGTFVKGFFVSGFIVAIIGALILSVINWVTDPLLKK